jgi:ribonuclease H / adenosylcobalamin/alpha-ribazole phosphatase
VTSSVIVEADGGARGNPGPAGFGAVVREAATGDVLAERQGGLGRTTNNVAEYEGLISGLEAARDLGAAEVDVRMDSKLVVEQMSGRWKIKHATLRTLAARAAALVDSFSRVEFTWIPRAENAHADRLANEAMDSQDGKPTSSAATASTSGAAHAVAWTGAMGSPTRFILLRHGQTALSVDGRYSGRGDVALTALGEQQANAAAHRVAGLHGVIDGDAIAPVISSPLTRTRQTAQAVVDVAGSEVTYADGLLETDFGDWEGLTFLEASERYTDLHRRWLGNPMIEPPNGESLESVFERVRTLRDELLQNYGGQTVVLVSHVTPIKAMLRLGFDAGASLFYRLHLDLCSVSIVEFYPDGNASVRLVNDTSHLL